MRRSGTQLLRYVVLPFHMGRYLSDYSACMDSDPVAANSLWLFTMG